jgi:hypothetical protein
MRRFRALSFLAAAALCAACLLSLPLGASAARPAWLSLALKQLSQLAVKPAGSMKGYSRARFGPAWQDVDHNHCNTRDDILKRDLEQITLKAGSTCVVQSGILHDFYTGTTIRFLRGIRTSTAVQIDHVVALADAWRTGANAWTAARRLAYANTPTVLLAVDGPANEAKGDSDASEWLPTRRAFDCRYIAKQIAIKTMFSLWLTPSEHDAMAARLAHC